jgi:hypothetical protein
MTSYWPFWVTAPALGAITVGYWILLRRPLGVSGVVARFSRIREEAAVDRGFAALEVDRAQLEAAMLAMTAEAFGIAPEEDEASMEGPLAPKASTSTFDPAVAPSASPDATPVFEQPRGRACASTPTLREHAVFLLALVAGGLLAALARGAFGATASLGASFSSLVAPGARGLAALAVGGVLVGFGTALCGGCTAGHGLTGSARLMPGSLVSTVFFFATAVAVSFLIAGLA